MSMKGNGMLAGGRAECVATFITLIRPRGTPDIFVGFLEFYHTLAPGGAHIERPCTAKKQG